MRKTVVALLAVALATTAPLGAQSPAPFVPTPAVPAPAAPRQAAPTGPKIGDRAPDFSLPASTRHGKLTKPVRLSELKGQVVVLAFFPKARTSG